MYTGRVNTEVRMIKYGYSNGKCRSCEIEDDTIEHLLYDCEIDGIWEHVERKLNDANIKVKIHYRDIILDQITKDSTQTIDTK